MPAYWVARAKITDPVQYKKYTDLVPDIVARMGKILARGGRHRINEGPAHLIGRRDRAPDIRASKSRLTAWSRLPPRSDARAGVVENVMVDGGDATQHRVEQSARDLVRPVVDTARSATIGSHHWCDPHRRSS
jgi:hypothetical protein